MKKLALASLLLGAAATAQASVWAIPDSGLIGNSGNTSYSFSFNAASAVNGTLAFSLDGYRSLDGAGNGYTDTFWLEINGLNILQGKYAMGGGGINVTDSSPVGATIDLTNTKPNVIDWNGGNVNMIIPIALVSGWNTIKFHYDGLQGMNDEGWGISKGSVSAVPVPAAVWLFGSAIAGFGFIGRRRQA